MRDYYEGPTRIFSSKFGTSPTFIDYMATTIDESLIQCSIWQPHLSDHLLQHLIVDIKPDENAEILQKDDFRAASDGNLEDLKQLLQHEGWGCALSMDVNDAFNGFLRVFSWYYDVACPRRRQRNTKKSNWYTVELREERDRLHDLYRLSTQANSQELQTIYRDQRRSYRNNVRNAKIRFNEHRIETASNKSRQIWHIVNEETGRKRQHQPISLRVNGEHLTDQKEISEEFGQFFASDAEKQLKSHFGSTTRMSPTACTLQPNSIFLDPVTNEEVLGIIRKLKNKKSVGIDEIPVRVLKAVGNEIAEPLQIIMNTAISTGVFPSALKLAKVVPVFKKGEAADIKNYRPISVLSVFSKIFEKVLHDKILTFMNKYNLLCDSQHGFIPQKSTETASLELVEFIHRELEAGHAVAGVFFDLSRAFDTLDLNFVRHKLYHLGIRGNTLSLISSFLEERKLIVRVDRTMSEAYDISMGVPQGSVLAPLIFVLFINDLLLPGTTIKFADDTSVGIAAEDESTLLQEIENVCDSMSRWCDSNRLILNRSKTVTVHFYKNYPRAYITDSASVVKFLGTYIDSRTGWDPQIEHICSGLSRAYYALLKIKQTLPADTLLTVYYALAYHYLSYNIILWGQATNINRVFMFQKRLVRLMFGLRPLESCRQEFRRRKILTVTSIYVLKCALYVHKNHTKFLRNQDIHQYSTRSAPALTIPRHRTAHFERSPHYACIKIYNRLPQCIKNSPNIHLFKKRLKEFLFEKTFYNFAEFKNE